MKYLEMVTAMYEMVNGGAMLDAFEKYYHHDVIMVEANGITREGKDINREYEKNFLGSIKDFHGAGVTAITSNEERKITMVETWMEVTFQDGNRMKMEQVAVQRWQGDQIIHERFYYNMPS